MPPRSSTPTNLTELARLLGVSRTLVSQVANHHSDVAIRPETRARILAAIEQYDVLPRRRAVRQIAVIEQEGFVDNAPCVQHPFFGERVNLGVRRAASAHDYALSFIPAKDDWPQRVSALVRTQAVAGLLIIGPVDETGSDDGKGGGGAAGVIEAAAKNGIPTVWVSGPAGAHSGGGGSIAVEVDRVEADPAEMMRLAVEALVRHGAREIAFLNPPSGSDGVGGEFRRALFRHYVTTLGCAFRDDLVIPCIGHLQGGQEAMERLLQSGSTFDAILSGSDYALAGALFILKAAGLKVPDEVQLISLGGDPICGTVTPSLASVDGGAVALGERGFTQLLQRIASPARPVERVLVRPTFTSGASLKQRVL